MTYILKLNNDVIGEYEESEQAIRTAINYCVNKGDVIEIYHDNYLACTFAVDDEGEE